MDFLYTLTDNCTKVNDLSLDIEHFVRKHLDMDLYIYYWYKPYSKDNLYYKHIRVYILHKDFLNNLVRKYKNQLHFVLDILH